MSSLVWLSLKQGEALQLHRSSVASLPRVRLGRGRGRSQDNTGETCTAPAFRAGGSWHPDQPGCHEALASRRVWKWGDHRGGEALRQHNGSLATPGKPMVPEGFQPWRQAARLGRMAGQRKCRSWREEVGGEMTPSSPHADGGNWLSEVSEERGTGPTARSLLRADATADALTHLPRLGGARPAARPRLPPPRLPSQPRLEKLCTHRDTLHPAFGTHISLF